MTYFWTDDSIRFMQDASEFSDFHERLAAFLAPLLPPQARVIEAGSGLGYLSRALAPYCHSIVALDRSAAASAVAARLAKTVPNMDAVCSDLWEYSVKKPPDAAVFCYFGRMEEILRFARKHHIPKVLVIKRDIAHHRFSLTPQPVRFESLQHSMELLENEGIAYSVSRHVLSFDQPFRSVADAVRFFQIYSRDPDPQEIGEPQVLPRLIADPQAPFPYLLPESKRFAILSFSLSKHTPYDPIVVEKEKSQ